MERELGLKVFQSNIHVCPEDIDENRHVNNVVYVRWMQEIAYAHSCARGWDIVALDAIQARWVIRSHSIRYLRPAMEGDDIIAKTWVSRLRRLNSIRKYSFFRQSDQALLATGETDWVFVDNVKLRPKPIHEKVMNSFQTLTAEEENTLGATL